MVLLFTEYDLARNSHVLHWNFSIPRATSYSVNSQATVHGNQYTIHKHLHIQMGSRKKFFDFLKIYIPYN